MNVEITVVTIYMKIQSHANNNNVHVEIIMVTIYTNSHSINWIQNLMSIYNNH